MERRGRGRGFERTRRPHFPPTLPAVCATEAAQESYKGPAILSVASLYFVGMKDEEGAN